MTTQIHNQGEFSSAEWQQYSRQIQLSKLGPEGQIKLKCSRVLIIGAGGLGSPVAIYLAAAGIGNITIIDHDKVEASNLQRQILFDHQQIDTLKANAAKDRLNRLNPHIDITAITEKFSFNNATQLIHDHDIILDCTDNFPTRQLINDTCFAQKKPWVFTSVYQFEGQCALILPNSPCFRCIFPSLPDDAPDCSGAGIIGVVPGILGLYQANEAIKYLSGLPGLLTNQLLLINTLDLEMRKIQLQKNTRCELCGTTKISTNRPPKQNQQTIQDPNKITSQESQALLTQKNVTLLDVRSNIERHAFNIGGIHIPLSQLDKRLDELCAYSKVICYCQTGARSLKAADLINRSNKTSALSLAGGLSTHLDSSNT